VFQIKGIYVTHMQSFFPLILIASVCPERATPLLRIGLIFDLFQSMYSTRSSCSMLSSGGAVRTAAYVRQHCLWDATSAALEVELRYSTDEECVLEDVGGEGTLSQYPYMEGSARARGPSRNLLYMGRRARTLKSIIEPSFSERG